MAEEQPRKLGREDTEIPGRYRITVAGRQRFFDTDPGDTVVLTLTEKQLALYIRTGVVAEHELVDDDQAEGATEPPADEKVGPRLGHGDPPVETVHGDDAAHVTVNDEAGPKPERK